MNPRRPSPGTQWRLIHAARPGCEHGPKFELRSKDFVDGPLTDGPGGVVVFPVRTVVERVQIGTWLDVELYDHGYLVRLGGMEFVAHEGRRGPVVRPRR